MMTSTQLISQLDFLDFAGNMLELQDTKDISAPGLLEMTGFSQHGMATTSGLNDYDYQNLSTLSLGHKQLNQVQTVNKIPIPTEILEHFKHIKCHCMMGLFSEIGRAWLTIDSEIYIWAYEQSRDVAYYDGLNHLIVSVGLVKPKPGVFINDIKYLLILTTPIEIIVLGVTFDDTTRTISSPIRKYQCSSIYEEMQLMNKPIFVLNTDNVAINVLQGSDSGRIFLGGRDGCLYEIAYQAESTWFGKRCKKINHSQGIISYMVPNFLKVFYENDPIVLISIDNSRQLLYLLTEKGAIEAWDMGKDCNSMWRIAKIMENEIVQCAGNIIKTVDPSIFKNIKSICPLSSNDCADLHLIAVTQCGVRLYFSTNFPKLTQNLQGQTSTSPQPSSVPGIAGATQMPLQEDKKPEGLYLLHIRLPPGYTPNTTMNKPKEVHSAFYCESTMLLISTPQQDQDMLWSISSAPFPNRPYLAESSTVMPLDGIVWSLAALRNRCNTQMQSLLRKSQKSTKVVLLTNQGVHIIDLLKSADILQQLLIACNGPHHEAIKVFFQSQTEHEACTTCLLIACSEQYRNTDLAMWAVQAFILYGGEPFYQNQMLPNTENPGSLIANQELQSNVSNFNMKACGTDRRSAQMYMPTPMSTSVGNQLFSRSLQTTGPPISAQHAQNFSPSNQNTYSLNTECLNNAPTQLVYSAKHDGLYLYVARLLRPIWKIRCIDANMCSSLTQTDCSLLLEDLYSVKTFLDGNSVSELSCTLRTNGNQTTISNYFGQNNNILINEHRNASEQAQAEEKRSLTALNYLIKHSCEVMALWKILCEHQFQILLHQLKKDQQSILSSCTFRDLILSRSELCALLIVVLINSYLTDNASVTSISSKLRDVCPNLYRHEDAVSFKATEMLMTSKNCATTEEKNNKLRTALQLCKDAAPNLPLQNICQQFMFAGFFEGVIELTATCAAKVDTEELALHYYNSEEPAEDREGYSAYAARMSCYKEVRALLDHVYQSGCNNNANQEFPQINCNINNEPSLNAQIMQIVIMAINMKDPLLHVSIYEWLVTHDMVSDLLAISELSLGEYLRRNVVRNPDNLTIIDLLWKYYEKNGHHAKAARILDNLASTQSEAIPLTQRIEYLARAVMCMRNECIGYSANNGLLLKELEDKLEIARVQKTVFDAMSELVITNSEASTAVNQLNYTLYDITQLYENFADPFDLWECKLTILNCSHHNDPLLIESVWSELINNVLNGLGSESERCTLLFTKIESLAKEFGESGHCFPLAFLIRELEIKACELRLPEGIVPEKFVAMNIDFELLMEYYSRMISMNERVWTNEGNEWHLVQSFVRLITLLLNNSHTIWQRSKRRVFGKAQDIISTCLNLCYQRPSTDYLQQSLKELQCRLQRSIS